MSGPGYCSEADPMARPILRRAIESRAMQQCFRGSVRPLLRLGVGLEAGEIDEDAGLVADDLGVMTRRD
jgi:hypothetical protein